jgi:hypothetical protein
MGAKKLGFDLEKSLLLGLLAGHCSLDPLWAYTSRLAVGHVDNVT